MHSSVPCAQTSKSVLTCVAPVWHTQAKRGEPLSLVWVGTHACGTCRQSAGSPTHSHGLARTHVARAGKREVFFEANGVPRVVEVADTRVEQSLGKKAIREKAEVRPCVCVCVCVCVCALMCVYLAACACT